MFKAETYEDGFAVVNQETGEVTSRKYYSKEAVQKLARAQNNINKMRWS